MAQPKPITVLLVDDHPVVRAGFRRLLQAEEDVAVAAEAGSGEEAYRLYRRCGPDVVVMDLAMPGAGGLESVRRLLVHDPRARVLVFSIYDNEEMLARALQAGVLGYLTKRSAPVMLVDAVRNVAANRMYLDPELAGRALRHRGGLLERLTPREFEVFRLLAEGHTVAEIGRLLSISPRTVGVHQTHVMQKLELRTAVQLVRLALRHGIVRT